ncbi:hypothetical protein FQR65_LT16425 [Abscondita terminalis]|nr:hypothetical protein FQR65_LT16425 [Abscondita terminalis]
MPTLSENTLVAKKIYTSKALHKVVYNIAGDRGNRKRLRDFDEKEIVANTVCELLCASATTEETDSENYNKKQEDDANSASVGATSRLKDGNFFLLFRDIVNHFG